MSFLSVIGQCRCGDHCLLNFCSVVSIYVNLRHLYANLCLSDVRNGSKDTLLGELIVDMDGLEMGLVRVL